MKLEKYEDKSIKKRKIILISISAIVLISISFLLYKTFASFTESVEFPVMKGQVDYFGNSDVYFAFYKGNEKLDSMPEKDNNENIVFSYGECDNGASTEWDREEWAPLIKNLSKNKTKCSLYFNTSTVATEYIKNLAKTDTINLAYDGKESLGDLGTEDNNLRYIGADPNNYVSFNNEIWRIIGVMKVLNENSEMEERLKIIRINDVDGQANFEGYVYDSNDKNDWVNSSINKMLNGMYYNSSSGSCYKDNMVLSDCEFNQLSSTKGLSKSYRKMIDDTVIWNIGGVSSFNDLLAKDFYEKERGTETYNNSREYLWTKENDPLYHNGIGLMYVSDYGYAVGSEIRNDCLAKNIYDYQDNDCATNNWLKPIGNKEYRTMTPYTLTGGHIINIFRNGYVADRHVHYGFSIIPLPVVYLKSNIRIANISEENYGSKNNPFVLG